MRRQDLKLVPSARFEMSLPEVLSKARDAILSFFEQPRIQWAGLRIRIMRACRLQALADICTAMIELTQLGLGGGCFVIFQDIDGAVTYRAANVDDLCRMTGLSRRTFYRAWKVLIDMGYVTATRQDKSYVAPGEFIVSDVIRSLTDKFWDEIGVGFENFKEACAHASEKAKQLIENGINAAKRVLKKVGQAVEGCRMRVERHWTRVYSTPELEAAAKAQENLSKIRNEMGRMAARCWQEMRARGEDPLKCFGCDKPWSKFCQMCLSEERAKLTKA